MLACLEPLFFGGLLMLHGDSYLWKPGQIWLHVTSDSLIALSYYSISILLVYFLYQRRNLPYVGILMMLGAFTIAGGTTHLIDLWSLWHPNDWLAEGIEAITTAIALFTALLSVLLISKVMQYRPSQLETANPALTKEIPLSDRLSVSQARLSPVVSLQSMPEGRSLPKGSILKGHNPAAPEELAVATLEASAQPWEAHNLHDPIRQLNAELVQCVNEPTEVLQPDNKQLKSDINGRVRWLEELGLLQSLTQVISEAPDFHSALCVALRLVCEVTHWDYGEAWLPRPDDTVLECSPAWYGKTTIVEQFRLSSEKLTFGPNTGLPGRVWTSRRPEWIEDISAQTDVSLVRPQAQVAGLKAGFGVPILMGDRVLAVLTFFITQSRAEDKRLVELVSAVATQLGLVMQRKQLEEELRQERDFSKTLIDTTSAFFVAIDANGKIIMMNQGFLDALGYTLEEVVGTDYLSTFVPETEREPLAKILDQLVRLKQPSVSENCVLAKNGRKLLVEWRRRPIFKKSGQLDFFFGVGIDITQRKQSEQESARLASMALLTPNPIVETDLAGHVRYLNPEAMRLLPDLQDTAAEHPFLAGVPSMAAILQREGSLTREVKINEVYYEQVLHYIEQIDCLRIYAFDITERKRAERQLIHNAFYDQLTGLPNRALFMDRLRQAVQRAKQSRENHSSGQPYLFAVLFLNLNRFKLVNDSLGSQIGDQLLQSFARRLQTCLRPTNTVARLGADEFVILLEDIQDVRDATRVADSIAQSLSTPFYLNESEVFMTLSIGIALSTTNDQQPEDLLRDADLAMYRAKAQGQAGYEVFDAAVHQLAVNRLQVETDLRRAIERQEFQVYYQPIVSLYSRRIIGFEALIRWHHPQRGLVSPNDFIPIAEETGLITPIGWWTLREACHQLKVWQEQFPNPTPLTMNVNLSCKQFTQPDLLEQIDNILQETQLAVGTLKLEITESVVMDNPDLVKDILLELKKRKIHLCIDDFGTGYSSLSRLHHFPISTLKIDRSFVSRIGALGENSEIVQAIVTLAQTLSMDVVAEGIEVLEQVSPLIALQCEYGQGYLFSKPVDSEAARALLIAQWQE